MSQPAVSLMRPNVRREVMIPPRITTQDQTKNVSQRRGMSKKQQHPPTHGIKTQMSLRDHPSSRASDAWNVVAAAVYYSIRKSCHPSKIPKKQHPRAKRTIYTIVSTCIADRGMYV